MLYIILICYIKNVNVDVLQQLIICSVANKVLEIEYAVNEPKNQG